MIGLVGVCLCQLVVEKLVLELVQQIMEMAFGQKMFVFMSIMVHPGTKWDQTLSPRGMV